VAVTPDGRRAVSASGDGTLRLWHLESGEGIATFIFSCAFAPDGLTIVAGDESAEYISSGLSKPSVSDLVQADAVGCDRIARIQGSAHRLGLRSASST
jgi:WD40 repeat protein